jgi:hypothetical protein
MSAKRRGNAPITPAGEIRFEGAQATAREVGQTGRTERDHSYEQPEPQRSAQIGATCSPGWSPHELNRRVGQYPVLRRCTQHSCNLSPPTRD